MQRMFFDPFQCLMGFVILISFVVVMGNERTVHHLPQINSACSPQTINILHPSWCSICIPFSQHLKNTNEHFFLMRKVRLSRRARIIIEKGKLQRIPFLLCTDNNSMFQTWDLLKKSPKCLSYKDWNKGKNVAALRLDTAPDWLQCVMCLKGD